MSEVKLEAGFKPGDVVTLQSGGVRMTVIKVNETTWEATLAYTAPASSFGMSVGNEIRTAIFPVASLRLVVEPTVKP
jgi:lipid-binding SYLF domain-containing protein